MTNENFKAIEKYFTGKAHADVSYALHLLNLGLAEKRWPKGASKKVHAALNKFGAATKKMAKLARSIEEDTEYKFAPGLTGRDVGPRHQWSCIYFALQYGGRVASVFTAIEFLEKHLGNKMTEDQRRVIDFAREFATAFGPVYDAVKHLDDLRPAPVYVMGGTLSAAVAATLRESGLKPETLRLPERRYEERERIINGKKVTVTIVILIWPAGTKHNATRYGRVGISRSGNMQCHACGHAIKNGFNWVPLMLDNDAGVPHSMWVGRDCAKNLFNVDMQGEAEYLNGVEGVK